MGLINFFFTACYFNSLQCNSELSMTTCYWLTMALSFFDSGKSSNALGSSPLLAYTIIEHKLFSFLKSHILKEMIELLSWSFAFQ